MADRVLSGMRPTGRLHLGNYFGALKNWVALQEKHDCFFFVADYHALTTGYENPSEIKSNTEEMVLDYLAAGLDPNRSTIFVQSMTQTHAEAHLLFSMITPLAWVERSPSYKEMLAEIKDKDIRTYGFLGYPVLQTVDVILYEPKYVPVGVDQAPHIELTREIVRRFNHLYKKELVEPETLMTEAPKIPGVDGRKMSKSYNNTIEPFGDAKKSKKKIMSIVTDSTPVEGAKDPDTCNAFALISLFCNDEEKAEWAERYRKGGMGYGDVKKELHTRFEDYFEPMREKRESFRGQVWDILEAGSKKAAEYSGKTLETMRSAMGLKY